MSNANQWFLKRSESFSPNDMAWLRVNYYHDNRLVTIGSEKIAADEVEICMDRKHQLDELIKILEHIRDNLPLGERKDD